MSDLIGALAWVSVLIAGVAGCVLLRRSGVASTHVRDVLHVGTGVWVLGWPLWRSALAPILIVIGAAGATAAVPALAHRHPSVARFTGVFASGDERWSGLSMYAVAYAALTALAFWLGFFPAGAALLALSLGDGIGGAVGSRWGRHRFRAPGGKLKSVEGSLTVAAAAGVGVLVAGWRFGLSPDAGVVAGLSVAAAGGEALAPRGTDNLIVPAVVWSLAQGFT